MQCEQRVITVCLLAGFTLCAHLTEALGPDRNTEFTFLLPAGSTECFYQSTGRNESMEVGFQVIAGAGLDVGFTLMSPRGYVLASDFRQSDAIHTVEPTEVGDYRLCFDNSFSKRSEKLVFFGLIIRGQSSDEEELGRLADGSTPESMVDYKLEDIRASMDSVRRHLDKSQLVQAILRAYEARDRYLLENNLWLVSFWSCVSLLVMLAVAVTQIYTLRCLFDERKQVRT
ncbi:transmembrane emp24 domain-containing protein 1a [Genypterus blacodes]|uniref:transmembrane emp24 domain-containing protein 1a n=1 Tax=Genypterus blacodes TaxID=154954 RepID=UPI003F760308